MIRVIESEVVFAKNVWVNHAEFNYCTVLQDKCTLEYTHVCMEDTKTHGLYFRSIGRSMYYTDWQSRQYVVDACNTPQEAMLMTNDRPETHDMVAMNMATLSKLI